MADHFGESYSTSWARDTSLAELGGRTVEQALVDGFETVDIWRAVWRHEGLSPRER